MKCAVCKKDRGGLVIKDGKWTCPKCIEEPKREEPKPRQPWGAK